MDHKPPHTDDYVAVEDEDVFMQSTLTFRTVLKPSYESAPPFLPEEASSLSSSAAAAPSTVTKPTAVVPMDISMELQPQTAPMSLSSTSTTAHKKQSTPSWPFMQPPSTSSNKIDARAAGKKVKSFASWAFKKGCPRACHERYSQLCKSSRSSNARGFRHQNGCAIKYAIEKIRATTGMDVSDPGIFTYPDSGIVSSI
mmetsp:Transcript_13847/g.20751  ORF Transcript_13847/g.20751 Transcript_13847/m.20751 type:complete len:198 (+) Transcript_13847:447-1040(+)|eukprot:CAMPEP_0197321688 /NCGR_PEP_ID=MMETSP0891-20130614/65921_1 /TAXON_ID=44058 ORGANISM="Aureoumbra lagunensis, Strain CCMP1510" /NCGR_SAMPLE_ID=MMETSP0891 /ASSEMBLY_ACC=CAM_ASM_000534 /LENGTH=197 /DNA_ID=CAMNT_0042813691 /DNA_START=355 /DNA_END=948 /DNA_ORIENTATION=-